MTDQSDHYVYLHYSGLTVFYVGRGRGYRAWSKSCRSKRWQAAVGHYGGYKVLVCNRGLTCDGSIELEREMIQRFKDEPLANVYSVR